jgi:hypothetical protein
MEVKIWAYGDSFVAGDQDIPGRVDAIAEHMEYNRHNISFASHLAKNINANLINRGISGCSNFVQLDKLWLDAPNIDKNDIVIFGLTTFMRDRFTIPHSCPQLVSDSRGPTLIHRELVNGTYDIIKVAIVDLFYVLSVIEKIEEIYNIKVIKFNLFHNILSEATENDRKLFKFNNFIGSTHLGNTLLDVLTDNWGNDKPRIADHSKWKAPKECQYLFTEKSHPSLEGHKLIAKWLEPQLTEMGVI